ncbi:MAG TPA: MFS transporter [Ilumatobacteraceae bacterium]
MSSDSVPAATQCWPELSPDMHPATNRILGGLMASSVLGGLGQLIALTVTGLLIEDLLGSRTWIGTGNAVMQIGTAGGAFFLSRTMARHGRRPGIVAGYAIGFCGGVIVGFGARWSSYGIVLVGLLLFGTSTTANLQARFAAADVVSDRRRARAVGLVVWSTTIGVVFGPKLSGPAGRLVDGLGFPELGGAYVVGGAVFLLAALVCWLALRPDPLDVSDALRVKPDDAPPAPVDVRACLRRPAVRLAISTLVIGQVVMVAIMSITAVHLRGHGYDLGGVGTIISGHVFGMYAPSPISGWLSDRYGRIFVIAGGSLTMVLAALLAATARPEHHLAMFTALLLLGVGWNANFVAGSALVTDAAAAHERPRIQGIADSATFLASAAAALLGGFGLSAAGYPAMAVAGACIAGLSTIAVIALRQVAAPRPPRAAPVTV